MLNDWIEYGGVEIANSARTIRYAQQFGLGWFKGCTDCGSIEDTLTNITGLTYREVRDEDSPNPPAPRTYDDLLHSGPGGAEILYGDLRDVPGQGYDTPQRDHPPWFDLDNADTWGFFGFFPLEVTGGHDDKREATIRQRVGDGAAIGRLRHASRTIYVRGLLVGLDDNSVDAGMSWLKHATRESPCSSPPGCNRPTLRMLSSCPVLCDDAPNCLDFCALPYVREWFDVVVDQGPEVIREVPVNGGAAWEVDFFMTAALPWGYSVEHAVYPAPVVAQQMSSVVDPAPAVTVDCLVDPDCPDVPAFPGYQPVELNCRPLHTGPWNRLVVPVVAEKVPAWAVAAPVLDITSSADLKDVRVQWFQSDQADEGWRATQHVTWLPANGTITLDAARRKVMLDCSGSERRADHLVDTTHVDGGKWPEVTCGDAWTVTVDVPDTVDISDIDVSLVLRVRDG